MVGLEPEIRMKTCGLVERIDAIGHVIEPFAALSSFEGALRRL
jgi:hypothetical protein